MTDHIPLSAAETAHRDRAAFNVAKEIQRQTEGEWEPSIAQSFAILDAALDALRGAAGERDEMLELCVIIKDIGLQRLSMKAEGAHEALETLRNHVEEFGFKGWRRFGSILLNMDEISAIWLADPSPTTNQKRGNEHE